MKKIHYDSVNYLNMVMTDAVNLLRDSVKSSNPEQYLVTGLMMRYYHTCHRELWLDYHGIEPDRETQSMRRGTRVDEDSYRRKKSAQNYGPISPDIMDDGKVLEVKPSSSMEEASRMQLAYYLWYLREFVDIETTGVLAHPTERERERVVLDEELEQKIKSAIRGIYDVVRSDTPPEFEQKPFCETCAFKYFCQAGVSDDG